MTASAHPFIPAKAGMKGWKIGGDSAKIVIPDFSPSFPPSISVIPAKAGIQTASAKPAARNQARFAVNKSLLP